MNIIDKIKNIVAIRRFPNSEDANGQNGAKKRIGRAGEKAAARYLSDRGFLILAKNFSCRHGELDIVARKRDLIVFTEVKTRSSEDYGGAEESVGPQKQEKIRKTASYFVKTNKLPEDKLLFRYDVFAVYVNERGRVTRVEHFPEAFGSL
ncbi:MAG: YraN family protein [bacterium]